MHPAPVAPPPLGDTVVGQRRRSDHELSIVVRGRMHCLRSNVANKYVTTSLTSIHSSFALSILLDDNSSRHRIRRSDAVSSNMGRVGRARKRCGKTSHRDLQWWNKKKVQCCLSCGELLILASDVYQSLSAGDQIRLLYLEAGEYDDDLIGTLHHVNLRDHSSYEAISYTWATDTNNPKSTQAFFVRHDPKIPSSLRKLGITANCAAALRRARLTSDRRILWIDSICIDQLNVLERAEQVELMREIYSKASRVLIFLGCPTAEVLGLTQRLQHAIRHRKLHRYSSVDALRDMAKQMLILFENRWFHRIWVIQEALLNPRTQVVYGHLNVEWNELALFCGEVFHHSNTERTGHHPSEQPPVLRLDLKDATEGLPLPDLLLHTSSSGASDRRDKIFALLSLAAKDDRETIRVDYTIPFQRLVAFITVYCISRYGPSILSLLQDSSHAWSKSWIPNFGLENPTFNRIVLNFERSSTLLPNLRPFRLHNVDGQYMLEVDVVHLETVRHVRDHQDYVEFSRANKSAITKPISMEAFLKMYAQHFGMKGSFDQSQILAELPSLLLHEPGRSIGYKFNELQPGVDPYDMQAIDLLAPWHQSDTSQLFLYCPTMLRLLAMPDGTAFSHRQVFDTDFMMGCCPQSTEPGDLICRIRGLSTPIALRRTQGHAAVYLGPCRIISLDRSCGAQCRKSIQQRDMWFRPAHMSDESLSSVEVINIL